MAIKPILKSERIPITVSGVTILISRITSKERQRAMDKNSRRGEVQERLVMDDLMPHHIHGYLPDPNDPYTWIEDEYGGMIPGDALDPKHCLNWGEDVKTEVYTKMHENEAGEDIRSLEEEGRDRLGNSGTGLEVVTSHEA